MRLKSRLTLDALALNHRNLLFWHEVGRIQNDTIPRDGWEMAALAIGLGGAIGELWVQDGLLLLMALGLSGLLVSSVPQNNSEKRLRDAISTDERAIDLACRFGYSVPMPSKPRGRLEGSCGENAQEASSQLL